MSKEGVFDRLTFTIAGRMRSQEKLDVEEWFFKAHIRVFLIVAVSVNVFTYLLAGYTPVVLLIAYFLPSYWVWLYTRWRGKNKGLGALGKTIGYSLAVGLFIGVWSINLLFV